MTALVYSRENLKNYIDTADEKDLQTLKVTFESYDMRIAINPIGEIKNVKDLPVELQKEIELGKKDLRKGRRSTHTEAVKQMKQKHEHIYWSDRAKKNYDDILDYLKTNWQPEVSTKFVDNVRFAINIIEKLPEILPQYEDDENTRKVFVNSYVSLFYQIINDEEIELICFWNTPYYPDDLLF